MQAALPALVSEPAAAAPAAPADTTKRPRTAGELEDARQRYLQRKAQRKK